jgi:PDZ domain-containing protein
MPIFRRTEEPPRARTSEERERARADRAARRAARTGEPTPPPTDAHAPEDFTAPRLDDRAWAEDATAPPADTPADTAPPAFTAEPETSAETPEAARQQHTAPSAFAAEPQVSDRETTGFAGPRPPTDEDEWPAPRELRPAEPAPPADEDERPAPRETGDELAEAFAGEDAEPPFAGHPAEHGFAGPQETELTGTRPPLRDIARDDLAEAPRGEAEPAPTHLDAPLPEVSEQLASDPVDAAAARRWEAGDAGDPGDRADRSWFDEEDALLPRDVVYPPGQTPQEARDETTVAMTGSQSTSEVAAARAAGYDVAAAEVAEVLTDGPSGGKLQPQDQILAVDGQPVDGSIDVVDTVRAAAPGDTLELVVRRDRTRRLVEVVAGDDDGRTTLGIKVVDAYTMPFDVSFNLERDIGGPSAGTIFALAIYDKLTPGELTGGLVVAGTGTMDYDGTVGGIGGIQQKIVSSSDDGASIFLAPDANCDEALAAPVAPDEIQIVRIGSLVEAIDALEALAEDPDADVPTCEAQ